MYKITIEGATPAVLVSNIETMLAEFAGSGGTQPVAEPKPRKAAAKKAEPQPEPEVAEEEEVDIGPVGDKELEAELNAPVPPAPDGSNQLVDAGTGKPAAPAAGETVKLTIAEVKTAATKLAAKDTPKLGELIKKHGGTKLSDIPKEKMAAFATDVFAALEGGLLD